MHKAGLAHRDIKVENIVLDKSERPIARLCDFGVSKHIYYESEPHSRVGDTQLSVSRTAWGYDNTV